MSDALAFATIRELGTRYRKRELSPVEVTRTLLGRIEQGMARASNLNLEPRQAVLTTARDMARVARGGNRSGWRCTERPPCAPREPAPVSGLELPKGD